MATIKLTSQEAHDYDQALADIICFMWGYSSNMEKDFNEYYTTWIDIMKDLRSLRRQLHKVYKINITKREV